GGVAGLPRTTAAPSSRDLDEGVARCPAVEAGGAAGPAVPGGRPSTSEPLGGPGSGCRGPVERGPRRSQRAFRAAPRAGGEHPAARLAQAPLLVPSGGPERRVGGRGAAGEGRPRVADPAHRGTVELRLAAHVR